MSARYERADLIAICERAFVPQEAWSDRDTSGAQRQLGDCYALLKAGCDFRNYLPTIARLDRANGRDWY